MQLSAPVVTLTSKNFIKDSNNRYRVVNAAQPPHGRWGSIVAVLVSWCGHCRKTKPEFERVAIKYKDSNYPLYFLDGDEDSTLTTGIGVQGFPTMIFLDKDGYLTNQRVEGAANEQRLTAEISKRIRSVELSDSQTGPQV
jgi:thiol-disulfide isomerase/thioredoxin